MADLEIDVYKDGSLLKRISRPIRGSPEGPAVTYRGRPYLILPGNRIEIGGPPPGPQSGSPGATNGYAGRSQSDVVQGVGQSSGELPVIPGSDDWDDEQRQLLEAPRTARLIVDAGPGTGKTAVACGRVASLMSSGVEPAAIWLISFTRTAVREIRDRIQKLSGTNLGAAAVRITTLDSHVWYLRQGFENDVERAVFPGYEESLTEVMTLLNEGDEALAEYLSSVEHLIVDEAQDFVGARAELIELLIGRLSRGCGVTVFTDDAQAIYGFSEVDKDRNLLFDSRTLPQRLRASTQGFRTLSLNRVHRTRSPSLLRILSAARRIVLQSDLKGPEMLEAVCAEVREFADARLDHVDGKMLTGAEDTLILYRARSEALTASSFLSSDGIRHRLRMSGLPHAIYPYIGLIFWDHTDPYMKESRFNALWAERVENNAGPHLKGEQVWRYLYELGGRPGQRLEMGALRRKLSRSQPPVMLCSPEFGTQGPIVGTIHGSKGREANTVHLMLSTNVDEDGDLQEEARVVFVGATRARQYLKVGSGLRYPGGTLELGRAYRTSRKPRQLQLEIGRDGDLDVRDQVSCRMHLTAASAIALQEKLGSFCSFPLKVIARANPESQFRYGLHIENSLCIATLDQLFNQELMRIGHSGRFGPKDKLCPQMTINNIYVVGTRTIVLAHDDPCLDGLHKPFDRTGIFLAPLIIGFPVIYFHPYR